MTLDRNKLVKVLGLTGSDHDGEIAQAGCFANNLVRAAGLTWDQALNGHDTRDLDALSAANERLSAENEALRAENARLKAQSEAATWRWVEPRTIEDKIACCLAHVALLTDWEVEFCRGVAGQRRPLSEKQEAVVDRAIAKLRAVARMRGAA